MGCETVTFERFTCERCGEIEDILCGIGLARRALWAWANAQYYQAGSLFHQDYKITLCPNCSQSLRDWSHPKLPAEIQAEDDHYKQD